MKRRDDVKELGGEWKAIVEWILTKQGGKLKTGCIWFG
jgi:hypothetical protein